MRKLILGLGSGRCGTTTLSHLFRIQEGCRCSHEYFSTSEYGIKWKEDFDVMKACVVRILLNDAPIVGDVAFYWINYVPHVLSLVRDARLICLKRDEDETVASFESRPAEFKTRYNFKDQLAIYGDEKFTGHAFPRYRDVSPNESLHLYYKEYYEIAERMEHFYPNNFKIFDIGYLNHKEGQKEILDFTGFTNHIYDVGKRLNQSPIGGKDAT